MSVIAQGWSSTLVHWWKVMQLHWNQNARPSADVHKHSSIEGNGALLRPVASDFDQCCQWGPNVKVFSFVLWENGDTYLLRTPLEHLHFKDAIKQPWELSHFWPLLSWIQSGGRELKSSVRELPLTWAVQPTSRIFWLLNWCVLVDSFIKICYLIFSIKHYKYRIRCTRPITVNRWAFDSLNSTLNICFSKCFTISKNLYL